MYFYYHNASLYFVNILSDLWSLWQSRICHTRSSKAEDYTKARSGVQAAYLYYITINKLLAAWTSTNQPLIPDSEASITHSGSTLHVMKSSALLSMGTMNIRG